MSHTDRNTDPAELAKFSALAHRWWDLTGEFRALHDINPLRLDWIEQTLGGLKAKHVVDIGCGGGLVSEGMARRGARVTGIDMADKPLAVAKLHALDSEVAVDYQLITAEALAEARPASCDAVTCLEMLEHVPDPASVVTACAALAKPGAPIFFSTLNRNPLAYATAVVGAEYVLNLLPKGTHDYAKFITPAELAKMARDAGLRVERIRGMDYNPFSHVARWSERPGVNYAMLCYK
jgi:2-polyprenyl-6-hydroxyphenyl methylase / 3-demethylubiquinone-9 3-methyltransferase